MALIDKTITLTAASAVVHTISFRKVMVDVAGTPTPKIQATAHGYAVQSDSSQANDVVVWNLGAAAETAIRNFMDAQATVALRTKMGLEV